MVQQNGGNIDQYDWGVYDGNPGGLRLNLQANAWQHLGFTRDAANVDSVYRNGVLVASSQAPGPINYSNPFLHLGRWGQGGRYWRGEMDEVAIRAR